MTRKERKEYREECQLKRIQQQERYINDGPKRLANELAILHRMTSQPRQIHSYGQYDNFSKSVLDRHRQDMTSAHEFLDELRKEFHDMTRKEKKNSVKNAR